MRASSGDSMALEGPRQPCAAQLPSASLLGLPRELSACRPPASSSGGPSGQQCAAPTALGAAAADGAALSGASCDTPELVAYTALRDLEPQVRLSGTPPRDLELGWRLHPPLQSLLPWSRALLMSQVTHQSSTRGCEGCVGVRQMERVGLLGWMTRQALRYIPQQGQAPVCPCVRPPATGDSSSWPSVLLLHLASLSGHLPAAFQSSKDGKDGSKQLLSPAALFTLAPALPGHGQRPHPPAPPSGI